MNFLFILASKNKISQDAYVTIPKSEKNLESETTVVLTLLKRFSSVLDDFLNLSKIYLLYS
jgi:hypothetical protein